MFKIIEAPALEDEEMVMKDMPHCSLAFVVKGPHRGNIVMRTASSESFEVMDLTKPGRGACWTGSPLTKVKMLTRREKITLEVA